MREDRGRTVDRFSSTVFRASMAGHKNHGLPHLIGEDPRGGCFVPRMID